MRIDTLAVGANRDGTVSVTLLPDDRPQLDLRLRVADGRVTELRLRGPGLTSTEVARLPWVRIIAAAEAARLYRNTPNAATTSALLDAIGQVAPPKRRPGRGGHSRSHYERIAALYLAAARDGATNPVQRITDELAAAGDSHSRHTVATWVRRCRELDLLPPAPTNRRSTNR